MFAGCFSNIMEKKNTQLRISVGLAWGISKAAGGKEGEAKETPGFFPSPHPTVGAKLWQSAPAGTGHQWS